MVVYIDTITFLETERKTLKVQYISKANVYQIFSKFFIDPETQIYNDVSRDLGTNTVPVVLHPTSPLDIPLSTPTQTPELATIRTS